MSARIASKTSPVAISAGGIDGYAADSQRPLTSLIFLLPMMLIYELGQHITWSKDGFRTQIVAVRLVQRFFNFFGVSGHYLPAIAILGVLLAWHLARRDRWGVRGMTLVGMLAESVILGVPLIFLCIVCSMYLSMSTFSSAPWSQSMILSMGAGVYEEAVFRLGGMTLLSLILSDLLHVRKIFATLGMVLIPAVLFSLYHYWGLEQPSLSSFVFRTLAGTYFGVIFLFRGFGVTAGAHAAYDVWIVMIALSRAH